MSQLYVKIVETAAPVSMDTACDCLAGYTAKDCDSQTHTVKLVHVLVSAHQIHVRMEEYALIVSMDIHVTVNQDFQEITARQIVTVQLAQVCTCMMMSKGGRSNLCHFFCFP